MYAVRDFCVEGNALGKEESCTRRNPRTDTVRYGMAKLRHRWPGLVREAATDSWGAGAGPDACPGAGPDACPGACPDACPTEGGGAADASEPCIDPDDELYFLGEECATAYIEADTLHYQAMKLLAEFHRRGGWQETGFGSTAEWLTWRISITRGAARERLRTALALEQLPETSQAMRTGEVSFTKVRALTRVATPDNEATLLDLARACSAANLERVVRAWRTLDRGSEVRAEQIRHRSRRFSAYADDDGMVVIRGRLDPEVGALLMRAVEAASDALYRDEARRGKAQGVEPGSNETRAEPASGTSVDETKPEQRRADAVGLIAERALAAGFGEGKKGKKGSEGKEDKVISGSRAERYQVMLHVDAGTLKEEGEPGQSELEDGTRVSAETSRRISCDSGLVMIGHAQDGQVVGAGRRKRTVAPSVRRALEARDRGCRFPGCGLRFTDAHHVQHWADGGESSLRNLVLLCRRHHRAVHEGGVRVCIDVKGHVVFFTPKGKTLLGVPPRPAVPTGPTKPAAPPPPRPQKTLSPSSSSAEEPGIKRKPESKGMPEERQLAAGLALGAPRYKHDRDIPWTIEARAWEALDSG